MTSVPTEAAGPVKLVTVNGTMPLELMSLARTLPVAGVSSAVVITSLMRSGGVPGPPAAITAAGVASTLASISAEAAIPAARRRRGLVGWSVTSIVPQGLHVDDRHLPLGPCPHGRCGTA